MREFVVDDYDKLIVTEPPSLGQISSVFDHYEVELNAKASLPPIIGIPARSRGLIVLDGHCRGYLLGIRKEPVHVLCITRSADRDLILHLESHRDIPSFHLRHFLMGYQSASQLRKWAVQMAEQYSFLTLKKMLISDLDKIEPQSIPAPEISDDALIGRQSFPCAILYDREGPHFIPVRKDSLRQVRKLKYEVVLSENLSDIRKGVSWARGNKAALDCNIRDLLDF